MLRPLLCCLLLALLAGVPALAAPEIKDEDVREECEQGRNCFQPDCLCPAVQPPGGLDLADVPQFVVLTFDDAVTEMNSDFYLNFKDLKNPNQCRITMTFFLSHLYTDYSMVNELYRLGHEIALHSVTHKSDVQEYWRPANESVWLQEMQDLKTIVARNAKVPEEDIKGWRAPFLEVGGDEMFRAIETLGLKYDSSWTTLKYTNWYEETIPALWPYTLDYLSPQDCPVGTCPVDSYPGTWVMPMLDLNDNTNQPCAMLDTCLGAGDELLNDPVAVEAFMKRNFLINYYNNKAPFGLYVHHSWFYEGTLNHTQARQQGYTNFLLWLGTLDDVFVVSLDRVMAWMKNPKPISEINDVDELSCSPFDPDTSCRTAYNYRFDTSNNIPPELYEVYMKTCTPPQPPYFPWLNNPFGMEDIPIPPGST